MKRSDPPREASLDGAGEGIHFEETLRRLETIVRQLEDGSLGLTDSLARYEEGVRCLKQCHALLQQAERKVELLTGVTADGSPVSQDFDEGDLSLEEKAKSRSRRRSKGAAPVEPTEGARPPIENAPGETSEKTSPPPARGTASDADEEVTGGDSAPPSAEDASDFQLRPSTNPQKEIRRLF